MEKSEEILTFVFQWKKENFRCPLCGFYSPFIERHVHLLSSVHDARIRALPNPEHRFAWRALKEFVHILTGPREDFMFEVNFPTRNKTSTVILKQIEASTDNPPPLPSYISDLFQPENMVSRSSPKMNPNNNNNTADPRYEQLEEELEAYEDAKRWKEYYLNPYGKKPSFSHLPKAHELTEDEELQDIGNAESGSKQETFEEIWNSKKSMVQEGYVNPQKQEVSEEDLMKHKKAEEFFDESQKREMADERVLKDIIEGKRIESEEKLLQDVMEASRLEFENHDKQMLQFQLNAFEFQEKIKMPDVEELLACETKRSVVQAEITQETANGEEMKFVCIDK